MLRQFAIAIMTAGIAWPALAQETQICPHLPSILAAADLLLVEPTEKPNFWRDHYGSDAAYLTIRYGGLDDAAADALLLTLQGRSHPPQRLIELMLARDTTDARMARIAALTDPAQSGSIIRDLGRSVLRALVVEDGAEWLITELARWRDAEPQGIANSTVSMDIARSVADISDDLKAELAEKAAQAGLWRLGLGVSALRDDLSGFLKMLDRLPPEIYASIAEVEAERRAAWIRWALSEAEMRPGFDPATQPVAVRAVDQNRTFGPVLRPLLRLIARHPDSAFLLTVVNQTGEMAIGSSLATELLARIEAGDLDPAKDPDAMMVAIVDGLDRILGREGRERVLEGFHITSPSGVQGERADAFVDRVLARAALAPMVRGDAASAPERPAALTAGFDWQRSSRIAAALAAGAAVEDEERLVAADLIAGAGRFDKAVAMLRTASAWREVLQPTHTLMTTLDRRCGGLPSPALPMMEPLYRFHPR